jgi:nitrous oxidase accessory protein
MPSVKRNRVGDNSFVENLQQVAVLAGGDFSGNDWTPSGRGNFWSGYAGYDADGDGLGDLPYQEVSLFYDLLQRNPELRLLTLSPAQTALDLAARTFPVFQPEPTLTDEAPLIEALPPAVPAPAADAAPLAALAAALVAVAAAVAVWATAEERAMWRLPEGARPKEATS